MIPSYQCPNCGSVKNGVTNSKRVQFAIWRRRWCFECKQKWTTYEVNETLLRSLEDKIEELENG